MDDNGGAGYYLHKKFKKLLNFPDRRKNDDVSTTTVIVTSPSSSGVHTKHHTNETIITEICNYNNIDSVVPNHHHSTNYNYHVNNNNNNNNNININNNTSKVTDFYPIANTDDDFYSYGGKSSTNVISSYAHEQPVNLAQSTIMAIPSGGKYVCTYCNLGCSKPSVLEKHIRAHTNERPYPCVSCGFSFKTRSNLYKHCRSRTHANRVMGCQPMTVTTSQPSSNDELSTSSVIFRPKPYKPRFHNAENAPDDYLSHHINELISKNDSIVHAHEVPVSCQFRKRSTSDDTDVMTEQPLNLTQKSSRKRSMSEVYDTTGTSSPITTITNNHNTNNNGPTTKSLIKELLLKNLRADLQCRACKMQFQTVTELELHKLRSNCRRATKGAALKQTRSNSVNVATILTQKHRPSVVQQQPTLKSPGPFLGRTRLVDGDKAKSYSFDDGLSTFGNQAPSVKLFGGGIETVAPATAANDGVQMFNYPIKVTVNSGDRQFTMTFTTSNHRVVKSTLQSGGTVLTNCNANAETASTVIPSTVEQIDLTTSYGNISDFSQNAVKRLIPQINQPKLTIPGVPIPINDTKTGVSPMNLLVNGRIVRHVPGIPGPIIATNEDPVGVAASAPQPSPVTSTVTTTTTISHSTMTPLEIDVRMRTSRPTSLPLHPSATSAKQHHGLTPTVFNQILISPETPRVAKKYAHHILHGNYFSYLGLKCSTKPVYCTLNKTQPFYVPHFKKLSMYSEWRQQETKTDRLFISAYDSRQRTSRYTTAVWPPGGDGNLMVHSSYKFEMSEGGVCVKDEEELHNTDTPFILGEVASSSSDIGHLSGKGAVPGGYESTEEYTYIRGRGRGRYVCDQCGIRCKKPSMLKKHIRTHSNDRPFTCNHCNFSFKTKGNLTKHMKSKAHTKNYMSGGGIMSATPSTMSNSSGIGQFRFNGGSTESDTDDSGMDSSDECARREEHEAAYGLLTLASQKKKSDNLTDSLFLSRVFGKTATTVRPLTYPYHNQEVNPIPMVTDLTKQHLLDDNRVVNLLTPSSSAPPSLASSPASSSSSPSSSTSSCLLIDETIRPEGPAPLIEGHLYDNSAMETLADIATRQVKLDKNTLAKSVASEYLKLATQNNEYQYRSVAQSQNNNNNNSNNNNNNNNSVTNEVVTVDGRDLLAVKAEGNRCCSVCAKSFSKPSQLRLHMNIHYLERPFRCDSCSVSFRTKGHLQKHERSASHHNKLSNSPTIQSSEPRPFKCTDCNIAFRIHGHLAKHLRSKMHIMKLECLAKIPFGLYAELERSNSLLTEINTADGDQCLESLKTLAKKVFMNDPNKLSQFNCTRRLPETIECG